LSSAPPLPADVRVVVAANRGPLTGPGTNSYLIGRKRVAAIDPGPDEKRHRRALLAAVGDGRLTHILITHHHRDHAGGAAALAAETGAEILDSRAFRESGVLADEEWRIEAVATPGHTPDHRCFALAGTEGLFSGDHVMGWASTMIAPPEGKMADYMASLELLLGRSETLYLPGHGPPVRDGKARVRGLIEHRKSREAAILHRLRAGDSEVAEIVRAVYHPLDPTLARAAEMSVLAHLEDLVERGLVRSEGPVSLEGRFRPLSAPT
jgi:glyoxylase-like metal-dependent hydrolase (beta-lactamase superfamily II)